MTGAVVPPADGAGNFWESKVYDAVTTLLDETPTTAIALIVSLQQTSNGPWYSKLLMVGDEPSRV